MGDFNAYFNTINNWMLPQDKQNDQQRIFQRLIIYQKILKNKNRDIPDTNQQIQAVKEDLVKFGLVVKRGETLQVTSRIHKKCFNEEWVVEQLKTNSIFQQILYWVDNDKSLQDRLCELALVSQYNAKNIATNWVDCLVEEHIVVPDWETKDDPWCKNWINIRDRLRANGELTLRSILILYKQIHQGSEVVFDENDVVQNALLTSGLIVREQEKLRVAKHIYKLVFNRDWLEEELDKLQKNISQQPGQIYVFLQRHQLWWQELTRKTLLCFISIALMMALLFIWWFVDQQKIHTLETNGQKAKYSFKQNEQLGSLVLAVEYGKELYNRINKNNSLSLEKYPIVSPLFTLQYILENISEKNQFNEHHTAVRSVSFSEDSEDSEDTLLASADEDGRIYLWNPLDSSKFKVIDSDQGPVLSISFSPQAKIIATVGAKNQTIRLWDWSGKSIGKPVHVCDTGRVTSVKFSHDGQFLATVEDQKGLVKLWRIDSKYKINYIGELRGEKKIESVSFGLDKNTKENLIVTAEKGSVVRLWKLSQSKQLIQNAWWKTDQGGINSVNFSPNGTFIATAGRNGTIEFRNLQGERKNLTLKTDERWELRISFSSDGKFIAATGETGQIQIWRLAIAKASDTGEQSWDIQANKVDDELIRHENRVYSISFNVDMQKHYLATGGINTKVRLWELSKLYKPLFWESQEKIKSIGIGIASDHTQQRLAILQQNGMVKLRDIVSKQDIDLKDDSDKIIIAKVINIHPDNLHIATVEAQNGRVQLWDFAGAHKGTPLTTSRKDIKNIIFSNFSVI